MDAHFFFAASGSALSWCIGRKCWPAIWSHGEKRGSSGWTSSVGWPQCLSDSPGPQPDPQHFTASAAQVGIVTSPIQFWKNTTKQQKKGCGCAVTNAVFSLIGAAPGRGSCPIQRPLNFDLIYTDYHGLAHLHAAMGLAFTHYQWDACI